MSLVKVWFSSWEGSLLPERRVVVVPCKVIEWKSKLLSEVTETVNLKEVVP